MNYPQWFIDELVNEEDKQRAISGKLKSTDIVTFICSRGHIYNQKVGRHIIISRGERWHGCTICGHIDGREKGCETHVKNLKFPQWFINELVNEEDKKRAIQGQLSGTDIVEFRCPSGHIYEKPVNRRIKITSMLEGKGCPICARKKGTEIRKKNKIKNNVFPQWFIEELVNEEDKQRAKDSELSSRDKVEFICEKGHIYRQSVDSHICISSMTKRYGCPICGRERQGISRRENLFKKRSFPQWFIDDLYYGDDKEKASIGNLSSEDTVTFVCSLGHVYNQRVGDHITLSTGLPKYGCLQCAHIESAERAKNQKYNERPNYPEWFINMLVDSDDILKAKNKTLVSTDRVRVKCPRNHIYESLVNSLIAIKSSESLRGCPFCYNTLHRSKDELFIENFITNLGFTVEHSRKVLDSKQELDIYIPEKKLAIEYNGSFYHRTLPKVSGVHAREINYHRDKFYDCKYKGIHLLTIFDVDFHTNQVKILDYLKILLVGGVKIYARKCEIQQITKEEANSLYLQYHLLGPTPIINISYGLYYNNELVSCMSFQKGRYKNNNKPVWCLTRFVTKAGLFIIGGASKLLSQFEEDYNPDVLVSYSDNDYFSGNVYSKLGFSCLGDTGSPRYYWYLNNKELKREQCQLKRLESLYPELYKESENKGNKEDYIMLQLGALKVYRSGHTKWVKLYN